MNVQQLMKRKVVGVPLPIVVVAAAGLAYWWYTRPVDGGGASADGGEPMDPTEGLSPEDTAMVGEAPNVTYQIINPPGGGGTTSRRCPQGYVFRNGRCRRRRGRGGSGGGRRRAPAVARYRTGGGRGTRRTTTAGRAISSRR